MDAERLARAALQGFFNTLGFADMQCNAVRRAAVKAVKDTIDRDRFMNAEAARKERSDTLYASIQRDVLDRWSQRLTATNGGDR